MQVLHQHYRKLVELAKKDEKLTESHSIEDAEEDHAAEAVGPRERRAAAEERKPSRPCDTGA